MFSSTFTDGGATRRLTGFRFVAAAAAWTAEVEPFVAAALKGHAPVGKGPGAGAFRDSIRGSRHVDATGAVLTFTSNVPHAKFVIGGTRPHLIRPRHARALYWVDPSGRDRFARLVHHPGTRPNRFVEHAVAPLVPFLRARLAATIERAFQEG